MPNLLILLDYNNGFKPKVTSFSINIGLYNHHLFLSIGFDFNAPGLSAKAKQNKAPKTGLNPLYLL